MQITLRLSNNADVEASEYASGALSLVRSTLVLIKPVANSSPTQSQRSVALVPAWITLPPASGDPCASRSKQMFVPRDLSEACFCIAEGCGAAAAAGKSSMTKVKVTTCQRKAHPLPVGRMV